MTNTARRYSSSEIIALAGSVLVGALFIAAGLGLGMDSIHKVWRFRVAPSTIAMVLLPIPATAWVVALWSRPMPGAGARTGRVVFTVLLVAAAIICAALTLFAVFMKPVERAS